jgi:NAD(P)-dependent dehydrogenase (short-subunit alcohol dehydrogenase family)
MSALAGRVAWLTGASSGIGRACALELARRGATVVASARRQELLEELVAQIERGGGEAIAAPCDVVDGGGQREVAERIARDRGRLDIAIANAGCSFGGRIEELDAAAWRRQLDINVIGAAMTARAALPHLRESRGRLALTGSVAAFMPAPSFGAYHASKYALRAIGLTLHAELAGTGVSCTLLHPGFVESDISRVDNAGRFDPSREDRRPRLLMWSAERAARVMIDAVVARRRELVFTGHGKVAAFAAMHFPGLAHRVMTLGPMMRKADTFRAE